MFRATVIILLVALPMSFAPPGHTSTDRGLMFGSVWDLVHGPEEARNYEKAVTVLEKLVESDYAPAVHSLAMCYYDGVGVTRSKQRAFELFTRAAKNGYPSAQNMLATMYEMGDGCEQSDEFAFFWYESSAKSGNSAGQYNLGRMYHFGFGVEDDLAEAYVWHSLAILYTPLRAHNRPAENFKRELAIYLTPEQIVLADERVAKLSKQIPWDKAHHNRFWKQQAGL